MKLMHCIKDVEISVPDDRHEDVSAILVQTGLFKRDDYTEINPHIEYKCGFPRLSTSEWLALPVSFVIFPASFCGLEPLDVNTVRPAECAQGSFVFSGEMLDSIPRDDIKTFCFPRLAPFIKGLAERYLYKSDDMAAVAAEHLVDGMNLSKPWCDEQLHAASPEVVDFVESLIRGKQSRIAYYQDNTVTCMVVDEEQASKLPHIPGYK